jgi:hypothetical protein
MSYEVEDFSVAFGDHWMRCLLCGRAKRVERIVHEHDAVQFAKYHECDKEKKKGQQER